MVASAREGSLRSPVPQKSLPIRGDAGRSESLLWLLIVFLILEYMRPPVLVQFKLQMLISLVLPVVCFARIKDRRWSKILTFQLGLLLFSSMGVLYATNTYAAYVVTRMLYTTIVISISMAWLLARLSYFRRAMWAWTLIMTYIGVFGITHGGFGPGGIIGDENELALACNTAIPMAFLGAASTRGGRRWAYIAIAVVLLAAVVITNSRGGFLGLVGAVIYILLISKHRIRTLAILLAASGIFFLAVPKSYINEILSIQQEASGEIEDGTGDARLFLWHAAFNMWKAHPLLGVGVGNSLYHTGQFQPNWKGSIYTDRDWSGTAIHSGVFEALSETGSVGILMYCGMIIGHFSVLRRVRRLARETKRVPEALRREVEMYAGALAAGMIGYLGSGLFLSVAYHPYSFYFSALALSLSWGFEYELQILAGSPSSESTNGGGSPPVARAPSPPAPAPPSLGRGLLTGHG